MQRFDEPPVTNVSRALQCYLILIGCAERRETITYASLAERCGYRKPEGGRGSSAAGIMGDKLAPILFWCRQNGLPPLTSIVVRSDTGMPGEGIYGQDNVPTGIRAEEIPSAHESVFGADWYAIQPPTIQELGEAMAARAHDTSGGP